MKQKKYSDRIFGGIWLDDELSLVFYETYSLLPSVRQINGFLTNDFIDALKEMYKNEPEFQKIDCITSGTYYYTHYDDEDDEREGGKKQENSYYNCYVFCKKEVMLYFSAKGRAFVAYSESEKKEVEKISLLARNFVKEDTLSKLFVVTFDRGFDLEKSEVKQVNVRINKHYNDDFGVVDRRIENFILENDKSGLIILHGKQGTGKTMYIRHLINQGKRKMLYLGGDVVDKLSDPNFISFVRKQKNSVFIIEDCEELLASRTGSKQLNMGLVNILNMSDGLLSDDLGVKFICTFNAPLKDIDEALLRKGRLVARYEFAELATEKVNQLIEEEKLALPPQTQPMTLADLYNSAETDYSVSKNKVGF